MSADITTAMLAFLNNQERLVALRSTRIWDVIARQNCEWPYQTTQLISAPRIEHMGGTAGVVTARLQINSFALTFEEMRELDLTTREVVTPLNGYIGSADNMIQVRRVEWEQGIMGLERPFAGQEKGAFVARSDMIIWHYETAIDRATA